MNTEIKKAKHFFYNKQYEKAFEIFSSINECFYEAGLCALMLKNEKTAYNYWAKNKKKCPACNFALSVLNYINLKPAQKPSFFQVRAQLEIFLNLFLENEFIDWAENLIANCDEFYASNPESYKFIARALFSNGYFDLALQFLKKTLRQYYCDPEAMIIYSQCQFLLGNLGEALDYVNRIDNMVDGYFPAKLFRLVITEEIKKKNN